MDSWIVNVRVEKDVKSGKSGNVTMFKQRAYWVFPKHQLFLYGRFDGKILQHSCSP